MYKKLLVALDGSRSADRALTQAVELARATGAHVEAIFIADSTEVAVDVGYTDVSRIHDALLAGGRATLDAASKRMDELGIANTTQLLEQPVAPGQIAATIVTEAEAHDIDLIVLGTHGRRGLSRLVMGSVAEAVVRSTFKPVLLIRSEAEE